MADADDEAAAAAAVAGADSDDGGVWGPHGGEEDEEPEEVDLECLQGTADVAEPAPEVLLPLLPFQKQFLAWGLKQVSESCKHPLLACCCCCCCSASADPLQLRLHQHQLRLLPCQH
jgi:hypothetical protein